MAKSYDINEVPPDDETPSVKHETERAKLYLQKYCPAAGDNLYDHLSEVLSRILDERPQNAFSAFEEYSRRIRDDKFRSKHDYLRDLYNPPSQYQDAKKLIELFKVNLLTNEDSESIEEEIDEDEERKNVSPNLFDLLYYFEQTDIGLPRAEIVHLNFSIKKLIVTKKVEDVRFWGKILGSPRNYYVVEATLPENEIERRLQELEGGEESLAEESEYANEKEAQKLDAEKQALESAIPDFEEEAALSEDESLKIVFPPLPINTWKRPPEVTAEPIGTGINERVYFVCNSPGLDDWMELPDVTPQQIVIARQIVHLFTGDLETEIYTFPPFPGSEKNYLRAQIARIGAATLVSPIGYFTFGNEDQEDEEEIQEEEEGEEGEEGEMVVNRNYEPLPMKDLIDPSMSNWCHHRPYLLKQGRVVWQDPSKVREDDDEEEAEEEVEDEDEESVEDEEGGDKGVEMEIGPPMLTPLSEDAAMDSVTPWTARQSSRIQPDTAVAFIRSNVWPGAFTFAADKKFANLYIGWGHKYNAYNYSPPAMPQVEDQYPIGPELVEIRDPSFEEEEAYRIAHLPPSDDGEEDEEAEESEEGTDEDQ